MTDVANVGINRKVLLFDIDHRRREIRAANLRMRGLEVLCVRTVTEARDSWHIQTYRLVLLEASDCPEIIAFGQDVRSDDPRQRLAFFVGKPQYLAFMPSKVADPETALTSDACGISIEEAFKKLTHKNGFTEASLRMQVLRSSRRGATTVRPAPDPWAKLKADPDAD